MNQPTKTLFNISDVSQDTVLSEFMKQFDELRNERINKEKYEINVASEGGFISNKDKELLQRSLQKLSKISSEQLSPESQQHQWILDGMKESYFSDQPLVHQLLNQKKAKDAGKKVIDEFVSAVNSNDRHLLKEKAYKTIGQLFVEIEQKHLSQSTDKDIFKGDLTQRIDNHYLKLLETPQEELRLQMMELLKQKLSKLRSKKKHSKAEQALIEADEFIGEDEVIHTFPVRKDIYSDAPKATLYPDHIETETYSRPLFLIL